MKPIRQATYSPSPMLARIEKYLKYDNSTNCQDVHEICPDCGLSVEWREYDDGRRVGWCGCRKIRCDDSNKYHRLEKPEHYNGTARC